MTVLLATVTVLAWGSWVPIAQAARDVPQQTRTMYVTVGNLLFASAALLIKGGHVAIGWRPFWLPLGGGVLWTAGNYSAFRASERIGVARAAGIWTPLNIVMAFIWGAALFGELSRFDGARFIALGAAFGLIVLGVRLIARAPRSRVNARPSGNDPAVTATDHARFEASQRVNRGVSARLASNPGLLWAAAAGLLWGSYFVPAQWAKIPAQVANFPLATGMFLGGLLIAVPSRETARVPVTPAVIEIGAGALWGVGNIALLGLIARVGTGTGFTVAQLSLLVNATIGIWVLRVPEPGTAEAHTVFAGAILAGAGSALIGVLS